MATEKVTYELTLRDLMSKGLTDINAKLGAMEKKLEDANKTTTKVTGVMKSAFAGLGTIIAGIGLGAFAKDTILLAAKFQSLSNSIKFASDSATQGDLSMQWISDISKKYGLEIMGVAEGFKTFQGAMMRTKFTANDTRKMFEQVNQGVVAMGLSADDAKGVYLALGQIMGKGKVQAEELRGQIGERIPGAFSIAARAMNMTTAELDKFMSDGKLMAEDFLPKFAAEMDKTFGVGAAGGVNSLQASINRLTNSWTELRLAMSQTDGGVMQKTLDGWAKALDWIADKFRDVQQLSDRASNQNTINTLANMEELLKKQYEAMKARGMSKEQIESGLRATETQAATNWQNSIKQMEAQLQQMKIQTAQEQRSGWRGLLGKGGEQQIASNTTTEAMYENNKEFKALYDRLTSLKKASKGLTGINDKLIDQMYKPTGGGLGGAATTETKMKNELDSIKGKALSNTYINIEALIKGDINNMINGIQNAERDMNTMLEKLEAALLTVVSDVNKIQN